MHHVRIADVFTGDLYDPVTDPKPRLLSRRLLLYITHADWRFVGERETKPRRSTV